MSNSANSYYKSIVSKLKELYSSEEANAMADRLFEHYLNFSPVKRVLSANTIIEAGKFHLMEDAVTKLMHNIPLQYVLGKSHFMDMEFVVNSSVLIPRPETEELVLLIFKYITEANTDNEPAILDIGTGSGCIAIALKRKLPKSNVLAIDISDEALKVAFENAMKNETEINFIHMDILDQAHWKGLPQFDIIVSNPPYVTNAEKVHMQLNVLDHEPHTALFVPDDDPLLFYREIFALAKIKLREAGSLWFEINEMFGDDLKYMAKDQGFNEVNIIFDFHGKSRFLHAIK